MKTILLLFTLLAIPIVYSNDAPVPVKATIQISQVFDDGDVLARNITIKKTIIKVPREIVEHDSSLGGSLRTKSKKRAITRTVYDEKVESEEIIGDQLYVITGIPKNIAFNDHKFTGFFIRDGTEKLYISPTSKIWVVLIEGGIAAMEEKGKITYTTVPKYKFIKN